MKNLRKQLEKRIPTIEAAYKETNRMKQDFSFIQEDLQEFYKAHYDAIVLVEAARKIERENGSGEINWDDYNQRKWRPWFWMSPSGFAFCDSTYDDTTACAGGGSRLRVLYEETADYLGENFIELWKIVQLK